MTTKKTKKANVKNRDGVFDTPGGQSYLENLRRLHPTELTERAIREVEKREAERNRSRT